MPWILGIATVGGLALAVISVVIGSDLPSLAAGLVIGGCVGAAGVAFWATHSRPRTPESGIPNPAELASAILEATKVDIIGIVPLHLLNAIRAAADGTTITDPTHLTYVTPARHHLGIGSPDQLRMRSRWHRAITELSNMLPRLAGEENTGQVAQFVHEMPVPYYGCLVRVDSERYILEDLPRVGQDPKPDPILISRVEEADHAVVDGWFDTFQHLNRLLTLNEITCKRVTAHGPVEDQPAVVMSSVRKYGTSAGKPDVMLPIAAVIARCREMGGASVVLKRRSQYAENDPKRLSMLTARLQPDDMLAAALRLAADDTERQRIRADRDAVDPLDGGAVWRAYNQPHELGVPVEAFESAAAREIELSLAIDDAIERMNYEGFAVLDHGQGHQLGFAVFTLDLNHAGGRHQSEVERVIQSSQDFELVDERAYLESCELIQRRQTAPLDLNHLLTQEKSWLSPRMFPH